MPKRVDANQADIVAALRKCGASVQDLHEVGGGCPDLLVGYHGVNALAEVKTLKGRLLANQRRWMDAWKGQHTILRRPEDVPGFLESLEEE